MAFTSKHWFTIQRINPADYRFTTVNRFLNDGQSIINLARTYYSPGLWCLIVFSHMPYFPPPLSLPLSSLLPSPSTQLSFPFLPTTLPLPPFLFPFIACLGSWSCLGRCPISTTGFRSRTKSRENRSRRQGFGTWFFYYIDWKLSVYEKTEYWDWVGRKPLQSVAFMPASQSVRQSATIWLE